MEARLAVLEQIAKDTKDALADIRASLLRLDDRQRTDFRVLFGAGLTAAIGLAVLVAHGFKWF